MTGSSGFIGAALSQRLESGGHEVVRLVRSRPRPGSSDIGWDPADGVLDPSPLEGVDAAVHLAGEGIGDRRWSPQHKQRVLESRSKGTRLLASTLAQLSRPPSVLLSASAIGFYGDRGTEVLTEESGGGRGFMAEVCRTWEGATEPAAKAGIRVVTTRTGLVLSPSGGLLKRLLIPFRLGVGGKIGGGRQYWSWITLQDEIGAMEHLLEHTDVSGPVNLSAPGAVTNAEFTRLLGRALGRPTFLTVPETALRLILGAEMAEELVFASQRVSPEVLVGSGYRFHDPSLQPALEELLA